MTLTKGIIFEAIREGYAPDQVVWPTTVGELMEILADYDEDTAIIISHDNGYTFGSLRNCEVDENEIPENCEGIYCL